MIDNLVLDRNGILALDPAVVDRRLTIEEFIHIATKLDAYWQYNYDAAAAGRVGQHALLKSGLHSDGFFVSRILLKPVNIRMLMAQQMVDRVRSAGIDMPTHVAGIPDGASLLGEAVAGILGVPHITLGKVDGKIVLQDVVPAEAQMFLVEDFCTRATGFIETVLAISTSPLYASSARILPADSVILNRGGLKTVTVPNHGDFPILSVVEQRINDWDPTQHCPLCAMGSEAVKPKVDDATWERFIHSQD